MVEKLCTPTDLEHMEHKQLQLRELAALNGTIKEGACFVCGMMGHDAERCPQKVRSILLHTAAWLPCSCCCTLAPPPPFS